MAPKTGDLTTGQLGALLADPGRRADAAIELGRRGAREYSGPLAAALPRQTTHSAVVPLLLRHRHSVPSSRVLIEATLAILTDAGFTASRG